MKKKKKKKKKKIIVPFNLYLKQFLMVKMTITAFVRMLNIEMNNFMDIVINISQSNPVDILFNIELF